MQLRRLLEARLKHGRRDYVQVLRLLETFKLEEATQAIEEALEMGTIGFDAVKHLLLCRIDQRPQGSIWRTIPTFRWPRSAPLRSPIT